MSEARANEVAVQALAFIAADAELLGRFLSLTGLSAAGIRAAAQSPGFLPGVLDFLLAHEPSTAAFAAAAGLDPLEAQRARHALGTASDTAWDSA